MISNGLGSFANLGGGYGLRLGGLPLEYISLPELNKDTAALVAFFISPSGEKVSYMQTGRGQAEKLESELTFKKYGGLENFNIEIRRDNKVAMFTGMNVQFTYKNIPFAFGFVEKVPPSDQDSATVMIAGVGYTKKLRDKKISLSVTNQTVNEIIDTLGTTYFLALGINYDASKNQAPATNIPSGEWEDKSIIQIIEDLISVSNENFDTIEYIYGVDAVGSFYFNGIQNNSIATGFFEGFNYQNAETDKNESEMVNRVQVYRTTAADSDVTEFVATYSDSDSIDQNGLFERKLIIADFVDTATAQKMALGIIGNGKDPKTSVKMSDLIIDNYIDFAFYSLTNKKQEQKNVASEFVSLAEWTDNLTTSTIALRTTNVFSGRLCYQWDINNSVGDNIIKTVEYFSPKFMRIYLRQDVAGKYLTITATGIQGNTFRNLVTDVPKNLVTNVPLSLAVAEPSTGLASGIATIGVPTANEWVGFDIDLTGFFKIDSIEIEVTETDALEILVDRLEIYTESYVKHVLSLEEITYNFGSTDLIATSAKFGQERISLTEKLNKIDKKNTIAYDIFSKQ